MNRRSNTGSFDPITFIRILTIEGNNFFELISRQKNKKAFLKLYADNFILSVKM